MTANHQDARRPGLRGVVAILIAAAMIMLGGIAPAESASTYSAPLRTAVKSLPAAAESNSGYDRYKHFGDWKDTDRDCQDTRAEVLLQETRTRATYTSTRKCTVRGGKWVTSWDSKTYTSASTVQIDHTVPVHEAWGSGARTWTKERRIAYYNDLGDKRALNAQTSKLNSAKGARGPEQWLLPPRNRCAYLRDWVAVKKRWALTVDKTEKAALTRLASSCPNVTITVSRR